MDTTNAQSLREYFQTQSISDLQGLCDNPKYDIDWTEFNNQKDKAEYVKALLNIPIEHESSESDVDIMHDNDISVTSVAISGRFNETINLQNGSAIFNDDGTITYTPNTGSDKPESIFDLDDLELNVSDDIKETEPNDIDDGRWLWIISVAHSTLGYIGLDEHYHQMNLSEIREIIDMRLAANDEDCDEKWYFGTPYLCLRINDYEEHMILAKNVLCSAKDIIDRDIPIQISSVLSNEVWEQESVATPSNFDRMQRKRERESDGNMDEAEQPSRKKRKYDQEQF